MELLLTLVKEERTRLRAGRGFAAANRLAAHFVVAAALLFPSALRPRAAAAAPAGAVFYDFIDRSPVGQPVLAGGVHMDADELARLDRVQKSAQKPPEDGYYRIRFVTDAEGAERARAFTYLFLANNAFSSIRDRFRIEYAVGDADKMNCRNDIPEAPRIIRCDTEYILSVASSPVHMTAVFTGRGSGGAGGAVPVVSTDYPLPTMLHEMLHVWGLNDEYTYSQSEADLYCGLPGFRKAPNTVVLAVKEPYASDADARRLHQRDIPWMDYILPGVPLTADTGSGLKLGTPVSLADTEEPGLYSGANCSGQFPSFRPYGTDNIMKSLASTSIPPIHKKAVLAEIARVAGW